MRQKTVSAAAGPAQRGTRFGILAIWICLALRAVEALGGGFLVVDPGGPYRWDPNVPVKYRIDRGGLNASLDEAGSIEFVQSIFQRWEDLPAAGIRFQFDGLLDVDVTASNARQFLSGSPDGLTPIVLDRDGAIIDLLAGAGSSRFVLGFASPRVVDQARHRILEGHAVINGSANISQSVLRAVMLHEFGHLTGLDHTQAGMEFSERRLAGTGFVENGHRYIPIMFPILYNGGPEGPQDDDILWLSNLYPVDARGSSTIRGFVRRASGDAFAGANVVLRSSDYNPAAGRVRIYSVVSDYLMQNNGEFRFEGIPPGSYELFIEPLAREFTEGSSVGPFDSRFTAFPRDFYNGARESGDPDADDPSEKVVLAVPPDGRIENLVIVANEIPNNLTALADDDSVAYLFPNGFRFPFYGKVYDRVFVNSDGNLTLGRGESAATERDLSRFVSGPPRIGGLFSDLNPEKGGEILFTQRDQSVSFTWMNVPEFSDKETQGASDGNQFSITLFFNGDVEFRYGVLAVSRGVDEKSVAVVGVTPGGEMPAQLVDLAQGESFTYGETNGLAQVFADSINLAGRTILFRSGSTAAPPPRKTLIVPFLQGTSEVFTALAVSNSGRSAANLVLTAYRADGSRHLSSTRLLPPGAQLAGLAAGDLLGPEAALPAGWIEVKADVETVHSFFQVGGVNGRWLDGAATFGEIGTHLYLSRLFEGSGAFRGKEAQTWVSVVNPNDVTVRVVLSLFSASGTRQSRREIKLQPRALIFDRVSTLFPEATFPRGDGYVSVQAIGGGIAAFELVRAGDVSVALPGVAPGFASRLYSAQLAHGGGVFTSLNMVNTRSVAVTVSAQAFDEAHQPIGASFSREIPAFGSLQLGAEALFGLGDPLVGRASVGSIEMVSQGGSVLADVLFGDVSAAVRFAAGIPLQAELATEAYFSHVATGRARAGDPASGYFTGIALFNPNRVAARVTLAVFSASGEFRGSVPILLPPGYRFSRLLNEWLPAVGVQFGGYIAVTSDVGIVALEMFGNETADLLSAVPADVVGKAPLKGSPKRNDE
ncbi:MAG: hypothetical protein HYX74_10540 [Acidobacteria bacterium]|nr:hypothetical protein [Acidobacteriota bacterium]